MSIQFGTTEKFPVLRMSDLRAREQILRQNRSTSTFTATGKNKAGEWEHALISGPEADALIIMDQLSSKPPRTRQGLLTRLHRMQIMLSKIKLSNLQAFSDQLAALYGSMIEQGKPFPLKKNTQALLALASGQQVMAQITDLSHPYRALGNPPKPAPKQ